MSVQIMQFNPASRVQERRQKSSPVEYDRRFSMDRRQASKPVFASINKLKNNVDRLDKSTLDTQQAVLYALSPLPPARRISSLPDTLEDKNYSRAGLLLGMAAANFPGDVREMGLAGKELKNIFTKGLPAISYEGQHQAKFFQNTFMSSLPKKYPWLKKLDKTLYSTDFGKTLRKIFNIKITEEPFKTTERLIFNKGKKLQKFKFTGNSFQKITGRALMRTPLLGLVPSTILEVPALIKSVQKEEAIFDKAKSFTKQLCKSAGYVGLLNTGIALVGATLMPYGYIAALIGMGIGGSVGLMASKHLNKQIDEFIV